jgi:hypothetical protein
VGDDERLFSIADVNALVPRLQSLIERLQSHARRLNEERWALGTEREHPSIVDLVRERPAARLLVEEMDAIVTEIESLGGQLKDPTLGLVDFPAKHQGEEVLLCWQYGEPEVAYWHREDEGFAGRKLLPGVGQRPVYQ